VVISTHTVNLQQQLVEKDIPLVARIFEKAGMSLTYGLFKGRNHYLCLRRWNQVYEEVAKRVSLMEPTRDEVIVRELSKVIDEDRWDGDREHLEISIPDHIWSDIASESDRCMSTRCRFKEECRYQRHRKELEKTHLIVANHALFLAHLKLFRETGGKTKLIPPFEAVVFDEAHHLEDSTRQSLSSDISYGKFKRLIDDTLRLASTGNLRKALPSDEVKRMRSVLDTRLAALGTLLDKLGPSGKLKGTLDSKDLGIDVRLTKTGLIGERFIESVRELAGTVSDWEDYDLSDEERFEVGALARRYGAFVQVLESIDQLDGDGETFVYWAEREEHRRQSHVVVKRAPLDVGSYLSEALWSEMPRTVLTSATLTTGDSFEYMKRMLGLDEGQKEGLFTVREAVFGSPFDYPSQACLCIPEDGVHLDPNSSVFNEYVAERLPELVSMTQGRTFVLFTAKASLDTVVSLCRGKIEERGYPVLVQGELPREKLLAEFKSSGNAVLFGLDSFWEGVDVPGDALSCVIVVKLPFPVPTEPLAKAREELWKKKGLNPFSQYSLPQATLKLKQGFGRLIRTKNDRGAVVIMDARIITKSYGKSILKSLPPARLTHDVEDIARAVLPPSGS